MDIDTWAKEINLVIKAKLKLSKFKTIKEFSIFDEIYINDKSYFRNVQVGKKSPTADCRP